jgi:VanZ family protein
MQKLCYALAPLYTIAIVILSLVKNPMPPVNIDQADKFYHTFAYLIMALVWYIFFYTRYVNRHNLSDFKIIDIFKNWSGKIALVTGVFSLLIGILIELGQEYISINRTMDAMDILANLNGIIIAIILLKITHKIINKQKVT